MAFAFGSSRWFANAYAFCGFGAVGVMKVVSAHPIAPSDGTIVLVVTPFFAVSASMKVSPQTM